MDTEQALAGLPYLERLQQLVRRAGTSVRSLRSYLQGTLPEYMVPAAYVKLEALPLNPTAS